MTGERQTETHQAESLDEHPGSAKYEAMRSAHNQALERAEAAEARVAELDAMLRACDEHAEHWESEAVEGVEDRIDRAVTERTAEIVAFLDALPDSRDERIALHLIEICNAIEREFLAPTRTLEASDGEA